MKNKVLKTLLKVGVVSSSVILGIALTASNITSANRNAISIQLKQPTFEVVQKPGTEGQEVDSQYYKSRYTNLGDLINDGKKLAQDIVAEGSVLLQNDNKALPLAKDSKVTVFGTASEVVSYGGRGSSHTSHPMPPIDIVNGLTNAGLKLNPNMTKFYKDKAHELFMSEDDPTKYEQTKLYEIGFDDIKKEAGLLDSMNEYKTAIYVISRNGGEGNDLRVEPGYKKTDSPAMREKKARMTLNLTENEQSILTNLGKMKKEGKFDKVIVLLNSTNEIEQADFKEEYGIDATLWIGHLGVTGAAAVGQILTGDVNPSGNLPDTFYYRHKDNPVMMGNYPARDYPNKKDFKEFDTILKSSKMNDIYGRYYTYQEGIYVGYRYSETRYTDVVEARSGAGDWDYSKVISAPFGSGLSYTTFEYSDFNAKPVEEKGYEVSVKVTNTGDVAGKDAVEIYLQKPYTEQDIKNGTEKAAVELVGFAKTDVLQPGASETVKVYVDKEEFRTYDRFDAKTYVISGGDYYLTAARDAHEAANNFLAKKGFKKTDKNGMTADGNASLVAKYALRNDEVTYSRSRATDKVITNLFDQADINTYDGRGDNKLDFLTRSNWSKKLSNNLKLTQEMVDDMVRQLNSDFIEKGEGKYPVYGQTAGLQLIQLMKDENGNPIDYNDPIWETFLNQLTWEDTVELVRIGLRKTNVLPSVGKPGTNDHNGPTGITEYYDRFPGLAENSNDPLKNTAPVYYPSIPVIASTRNVEIATRFGDILGEDALWAGYNGLYGIGLNTHRSPYAGRQFEYWSEDPFLAGTLAAAQVKALQSHGCNAYIKHFALNDQEMQRNNVHIWSNEQALREISLRPYEKAVIDGGAMNAMASFTRIGAQMVPGCKALLTDYLREELGMKGLVVTDMFNIGYKPEMMAAFIEAGCDIPDGEIKPEVFDQYKTGYPALAHAMQKSAKRILYSTVRSNAMNGIDSNTIVRQITPPWEKLMNGVKIASIVYFSAMMVCGAVALGFELKKKFLIKKQLAKAKDKNLER